MVDIAHEPHVHVYSVYAAFIDISVSIYIVFTSRTVDVPWYASRYAQAHDLYAQKIDTGHQYEERSHGLTTRCTISDTQLARQTAEAVGSAAAGRAAGRGRLAGR